MMGEKELLTEKEIREIIRREGYWNCYKYIHSLPRDQYQSFNKVINPMIWGDYKKAHEGSYKPEERVIIAYTNEYGELCLRFRTSEELKK